MSNGFPNDELPHDAEDSEPIVSLPIEWHIPDNIEARSVTNFVVQQTEHEFVISFFELFGPLLIGTQAEQQEQARQIKSVRAKCVARVVVSASRMPDLIKLLQDSYGKWQARFEEGDIDDE